MLNETGASASNSVHSPGLGLHPKIPGTHPGQARGVSPRRRSTRNRYAGLRPGPRCRRRNRQNPKRPAGRKALRIRWPVLYSPRHPALPHGIRRPPSVEIAQGFQAGNVLLWEGEARCHPVADGGTRQARLGGQNTKDELGGIRCFWNLTRKVCSTKLSRILLSAGGRPKQTRPRCPPRNKLSSNLSRIKWEAGDETPTQRFFDRQDYLFATLALQRSSKLAFA